MKLEDIPRFPRANYQVNIGWDYIDKFYDGLTVNLDPDYQRGYVWSQYQKERYVEYRLKGGFSGKDIFWNCPNWNYNGCTASWNDTLELVDGKQRINAVRGFMNDEVRAFGLLKSQYTDAHRMSGIHHDLVFHVNNLQTKKEVIEWYLGMNAGGSIHTEDDLLVARNLLTSLT